MRTRWLPPRGVLLMTRLAEVKAERDEARRRASMLELALRDVVVGDVERGGERVTVAVGPGECGPDEPLMVAVILRPLGADPMALVRIGDTVELYGADGWVSGLPYTLPLSVRALKERLGLV